MQGKKVLVTGAGTGIGRGLASAFAEAGADLVVHYSHSSEGAEQVVREARNKGVRAEMIQADFEDVKAVQSLGRHAISFLGGLDVLVNNAGITMNKPFGEVTPEQFDTLFSVNIKGMFFLTQAVSPTLIEQRHGVIINMSSVHAFQGLREHSVYASTKGAINSFTRQLAIELAPHGIRVNAVAAGAIEVENHQKFIPGYRRGSSAKRNPTGFKGDPSDIAGLAMLLASDYGRYIIGQTIVVDGGFIGYMPVGEDFTSPFNWTFGAGYVQR